MFCVKHPGETEWKLEDIPNIYPLNYWKVYSLHDYLKEIFEDITILLVRCTYIFAKIN